MSKEEMKVKEDAALKDEDLEQVFGGVDITSQYGILADDSPVNPSKLRTSKDFKTA